jgi:membrane protein DedA with SNARE-associated domain
MRPLHKPRVSGMPHTDLPGYIYHLSWLGIFLWFAFLEQLTPVPEEISLMTLGYISITTSLNPLISGAVAAAGLLTADNLLFYFSLKGNKLTKKLTDNTNIQLLGRLKRNLQHEAKKTLIIMALLPKLRFLSPVIAGTAGISWKLFFFVNSAVTVFYVAVYMLIGILFHSQLGVVLRKVKLWQHIIFIGAMAGIAVFLILTIGKIVKKK